MEGGGWRGEGGGVIEQGTKGEQYIGGDARQVIFHPRALSHPPDVQQRGRSRRAGPPRHAHSARTHEGTCETEVICAMLRRCGTFGQ